MSNEKSFKSKSFFMVFCNSSFDLNYRTILYFIHPNNKGMFMSSPYMPKPNKSIHTKKTSHFYENIKLHKTDTQTIMYNQQHYHAKQLCSNV